MPGRVNPNLDVPASAMIDFRTISIFADVYLDNNYGTGATNYNLHLPRNTASLIQQITITCNGVQYVILMIIIFYSIPFMI